MNRCKKNGFRYNKLLPFLCRHDFSHDYNDVEEICKAILNLTTHRPTIGIICGSGLSSLGDIVQEKVDIPYEKIKQFPKSTGKLNYFENLKTMDTSRNKIMCAILLRFE